MSADSGTFNKVFKFDRDQVETPDGERPFLPITIRICMKFVIVGGSVTEASGTAVDIHAVSAYRARASILPVNVLEDQGSESNPDFCRRPEH